MYGGDLTGANCKAYSGCGMTFQLQPSETLIPIYDFTGGFPTSLNPAQNPQVNGASPLTPLAVGPGGTVYGTTIHTIYSMTVTHALQSPVQLTFDPEAVPAGSPSKLSWKVLNAFSNTAQVCAAFIRGNTPGAGIWSGVQKERYRGKSTAAAPRSLPLKQASTPTH